MFRDISQVIDKVTELSHKHYIVLLTGGMGAGKTFFVKEYMRRIHKMNTVTSPTYTTCNTYIVNDDYMIKHFDFYIKTNESELLIALETANLVFIEWWTPIAGHSCIEVNCETEAVNILKF